MDLGNKLLSLRKKEGLSQEEVADKLGVSRQSVSKWETNQSLPDFDKILPLCELYSISSDELLKGETLDNKMNVSEDNEHNQNTRQMRAKFTSSGILLYFVAIAWFMISVPVFDWNPMFSIAIFLLICGVATYTIVYGNIVFRTKRTQVSERDSRVQRRVIAIVTLVMTCLYFLVSFVTFAWHITWILWIVNAIIIEIVKLIFALGGKEDEK